MARAAAKVFAIPELLEHILLFVHDIQFSDVFERDISKFRKPSLSLEVNLDCWQDPIKQLFLLQRVSKTFQSTIQGSVRLRRCMELDYKSNNSGEAAEVSTFLEFVIPQSRVYELDSDDTECGILLHLIITPSGSNFSIIAGERHSWRDMKVTRTKVLLQIDIDITYRDTNSDFRYQETYIFAAGEGTLGQLADIFNEIRQRSAWLHWYQAKFHAIFILGMCAGFGPVIAILLFRFITLLLPPYGK